MMIGKTRKKALKDLFGMVFGGLLVGGLGVLIGYAGVSSFQKMLNNPPDVSMSVNGIPIPPILLPILGVLAGACVVFFGLFIVYQGFDDNMYWIKRNKK